MRRAPAPALASRLALVVAVVAVAATVALVAGLVGSPRDPGGGTAAVATSAAASTAVTASPAAVTTTGTAATAAAARATASAPAATPAAASTPSTTPATTATPSPVPTTSATSAAAPAAPAASPSARATAASAPATPTATVAAPATGAATTLTWQGQSFDAAGVNVPWVQWACDFGCGTQRGVSSAASMTALSSRFAQVQAAGVHVVRWWMLEGDPSQIIRAADGTPTGIDPDIYPDIDAALALARKYDLYYDFVLFAAPDQLPQSWFTDPAQRTALANVLGQLFAHYANEPRIMSWEVFNEPEWDYWRKGYAQQPIIDLTRAVVESIHAHSHAMATVGSAMIDALPDWVGVGLDYYQVHWYDQMSSGTWCAMCTTYQTLQQRYGLNAPVVIGEFYAGPDVDALQRLKDFASKGYAGAWAWSLFPEHTADKMAIDLAAYRAFTSSGVDVGPR